jgi:hypothetical protein
MQPSLSSRSGRRGQWFILLIALLPLQGCNDSDDDDDDDGSRRAHFGARLRLAARRLESTPTVGNDATDTPSTTAPMDLLTEINNFRAGNGLNALTLNSTAGDAVASDAATAWMNSGFQPNFSFDTTTDLNNRGISVTFSQLDLARGFSTAQEVFNNLQQNFDPFSGNYSNIGIALIDPGNGNVWAIVQW